MVLHHRLGGGEGRGGRRGEGRGGEGRGGEERGGETCRGNVIEGHYYVEIAESVNSLSKSRSSNKEKSHN